MVATIDSGDPHSVLENSGPANLTSTLHKVVEKLIQIDISQYPGGHSVFFSSQWSPMRNLTCLTNFLQFLDENTRMVNACRQVEVCYLDFRRALDSWNKCLLLSNSKSSNNRGQTYHWVQTFLSGETFYLRIGDSRSTKLDITSGVPQGHASRLLLFMLSVNSLSSHLKSFRFFFANGVKMILSSDRNDLKRDVMAMLDWKDRCKFPQNASESHLLSRSTENIAISHDQLLFAASAVNNCHASFEAGGLVFRGGQKTNGGMFTLKQTIFCHKSKVLMLLREASPGILYADLIFPMNKRRRLPGAGAATSHAKCSDHFWLDRRHTR